VAEEASMNAHATIRQRVEAYLKERRQAGLALRVIGSQLKSFARFAEDRGHRGPLTLDLALAWVQASRRASPVTAAGRLEQLRPFTQFCHRLDPANVIAPEKFFGPRRGRVTPHIYTPQEIRALMDAAARWGPAGCLRAESYATLFGLLAATGLRLSEALNLERRDVDLKHGVLHIREAKFHKSRYVPLHPTTIRALRRYTRRRDRDALSATTALFFIADQARRLPVPTVRYAFDQLRQKLGWHCRGGHPAPRIHDLRFTFICRRLERWYAQGLDIDRLMLSLYTYVGHVNVTSTYWYLTATPELMRLAARRLQSFKSGGGS
jgi:integrase